MEDERLKEAFLKVKHDMDFLNNEIFQIKQEIHQIYNLLSGIPSSTLQHINPTHPTGPTHNPTHPQEIGGLKTPNLGISTGNGGVPTHQHTNTPTHQHKVFHPEIPTITSLEKNIFDAREILESLDSIKKEIRLKFKQITNQEMLVFSTIYQLEEQNISPDHKQLALKLKLSESSIRDYINRLINKGIPIKKHRIDNKRLVFSISPELKKIVSLNTILQLRSL
ncbi:MAG: MarR family winged helix-turn-helix transcriptional regulator [Nanoarchaeota archaeon]